MDPVKFNSQGREYHFTPWSAFRAITEWGDLAADLGEGIAEHLLAGDLSQIIAGLQEKSGTSALVLQGLLEYLGDSDLGERVRHYLDSGQVEVGTADGWAPLHGPQSDDTAGAEGLSGLDLLGAAWHVVREGLRPLSGLLSSIERGQESKSTKISSESEGSA